MLEYYLLYDLKTGRPTGQHGGPIRTEEVPLQARPEEGIGALGLATPPFTPVDDGDGAIAWRLDIDGLRTSALGRIDAAASAEIARHANTTIGGAGLYAMKAAEAAALALDPDAMAPLLRAEAKAVDRPVADVAADVIAAADRCRHGMIAIEAARQGAKAIVREATDLRDIAEAETTDWAAVAASKEA